jgi:hypothetical protein
MNKRVVPLAARNPLERGYSRKAEQNSKRVRPEDRSDLAVTEVARRNRHWSGPDGFCR